LEKRIEVFKITNTSGSEDRVKSILEKRIL